MSYLGLDLGTKTLGLAISDKTNTIAQPYKVIRYQTTEQLIKELAEIIKAKAISLIVLGYPKNMNNSLGPAVTRTLEFKNQLEQELALPVELVDERLSTVAAENILLMADMSRNKRKKKIDGLAASIILETYLKMKGDKK